MPEKWMTEASEHWSTEMGKAMVSLCPEKSGKSFWCLQQVEETSRKSGGSREVFVGIWKVETRKHISAHDHLSGEMASIRAAKHERHVAQHYSYCLVLHFLCQCWDVVYGYGGMLQATNWGAYPPKKKHVTDFWVDLAMAFPLADQVLNLAKATLGGIPPKSWGNHHSCPWRNPHRFFVEHVIKKAKLAWSQSYHTLCRAWRSFDLRPRL